MNRRQKRKLEKARLEQDKLYDLLREIDRAVKRADDRLFEVQRLNIRLIDLIKDSATEADMALPKARHWGDGGVLKQGLYLIWFDKTVRLYTLTKSGWLTSTGASVDDIDKYHPQWYLPIPKTIGQGRDIEMPQSDIYPF